jgi:hypothetical protein
MKPFLNKFIISILIFFLCLELFLRISEKYKTRSEFKGKSYSYKYKVHRSNWYYTNKPNTSRIKKEKEWQYFNQYNEFGNREKSIQNFIKDTTSIKIICLGDSFTEGDGAPYDSSWVRKFEYCINLKNKTKYKIYNAGSCGSDVFYNYKILTDKLMLLKPQIVIECINSTDVSDVIWRGGLERFNEDGTVSGKVGPSWEFVYHISHVFRAFMHVFFRYNEDLISENDLLLKEKEAIELIENQIKQTAQFCLKNKIEYHLLIHPLPSELIEDAIEPFELVEQLKNKPYVTLLFESFNDYYRNNDIVKDYWVVNKHYNSKGYFSMGNIIYNELKLYTIK